MDQINVKSLTPADAAKGLEIANFQPPSQRDGELAELQEWEMVLAGGGEGIPCW